MWTKTKILQDYIIFVVVVVVARPPPPPPLYVFKLRLYGHYLKFRHFLHVSSLNR